MPNFSHGQTSGFPSTRLVVLILVILFVYILTDKIPVKEVEPEKKKQKKRKRKFLETEVGGDSLRKSQEAEMDESIQKKMKGDCYLVFTHLNLVPMSPNAVHRGSYTDNLYEIYQICFQQYGSNEYYYIPITDTTLELSVS